MDDGTIGYSIISANRKAIQQRENSIHEEWLASLREENVRIENEIDHFENIHLVQINYKKIVKMTRNIPIKKLKLKNVFFHSLYPVTAPSCIQSWPEMLSMNVKDEWSKVWRKISTLTCIVESA